MAVLHAVVRFEIPAEDLRRDWGLIGSRLTTNRATRDDMTLLQHSAQVFVNERHAKRTAYGLPYSDIMKPDEFDVARGTIAAFPEYAPTPLHSLGGLAREVGVDAIWYKDESGRFGIGSFKALGAPYAAARLLFQILGIASENPGDALRQLLRGSRRAETKAITFASATDGNHGRALAWGAQRFGCACNIYVPREVTANRVRAIERFGAKVTRIDGNYDDAVHAVARDAERECWYVVSDTSYPGYQEVPRNVMNGYTVMVGEAISQLPQRAVPTHVFVQAGVGALAAAVIARIWNEWGGQRPFTVIVEPTDAACVFHSAREGRPVRVHGELSTLMGGLACGEVSELAWPLMRDGADAFMTIEDAAAEDTMRRLASGTGAGVGTGMSGEASIVGGESGVAGLAAARVALANNDIAEQLLLDSRSRILVFGTEGATDPETYERIVGTPIRSAS